MRASTWFLRVTLGGLALLAVVIGVIPFPIMLSEMGQGAPAGLGGVVVSLGVGVYLALLAFLVAVLVAEQLLSVIERGTAFTNQALTKLRHLTWALVALTLGVWLWLPFIYTAARLDDAPGLMVIGLAVALVPVVLTVFMAVLTRLWQAALAYKTDTDVTI